MSGRIMIVDDAVFLRMMLKDKLTYYGYEVVVEAEKGAVGTRRKTGFHDGYYDSEMDGVISFTAP